MPRKLGPKLILSLTILIVAISCVSGYLNFRTQKKQLVETMILGADQLSRSITSATWHAMLDDDRKAAYEIMRVIADKQGVDRIRMFNREGRLVFSTDADEQPGSDQPFERGLRQLSRARTDSKPAGRRFARSLCNVSGWREDDQHGGADLQRAIVQQCQLPRSPRVDQSAWCGGCGACVWIQCSSRHRAITLQTVAWTLLEVGIGAAFVILFTQAFRGDSDRAADRRHEGCQRDGTGPADHDDSSQPGTR